MRRKRSISDGCDIDMTPMIDVVFQMIIFFIVTMKMDENINEDIKLEDARQAEAYKGEDPRTMIIEVDRRGWLSISNCQLTEQRLGQLIKHRFQKLGTFPVMIRADKRTQHKDVRKIMDLCTDAGIWRIDFAAIKEPK
jgi:biopolymer transport protein ExbD